MSNELAFRRAQVYRFLADAFLYPQDLWPDDGPTLDGILCQLGEAATGLEPGPLSLTELQAEHRRAFGLTGSMCYETEYGLPHEFRQSQELADIAGFYRAFGFTLGGEVRERPDHVAVELEFMHVLALKEAYAHHSGFAEGAAICAEAQRKFLQDHLGRWCDLFAAAVAQNAVEGPYVHLARVAAGFVRSDAARVGALVEPLPLRGTQPTPLGPPLACDACPVGETS